MRIMIGMSLTGMQLGRGRMIEKGAAVVLFVMGMVTGMIPGKGTGMKGGTAAVL